MCTTFTDPGHSYQRDQTMPATFFLAHRAYLCLFFFFFKYSVSLYSAGCPQTHDPPAKTSQVLGLQAHLCLSCEERPHLSPRPDLFFEKLDGVIPQLNLRGDLSLGLAPSHHALS
jgi:hypothetical protein